MKTKRSSQKYYFIWFSFLIKTKSMNSPFTIIHTPTNQLEKSLDFYQKLNYKVFSESNPTLLTDGKFVIEINPDRFARAGLKMFQSNWESEVLALKKLTEVTSIENGYMLGTPTGTRIYLMNEESNIDFTPSEMPLGMTGNFAGLSLETTDMGQSAAIWEVLGYEKTMGSIEKGWIAFSNKSGIDVSLMKPNSCPHLFFNPSLTFFNGKINNPKIIQNIRNAGIPITEEITVFNKEGIVDNVIIRDPGGYGFFIYND